MSANRTTADARQLDNITWRIFREGGLGYGEAFGGDVFWSVLPQMARYEVETLARIGNAFPDARFYTRRPFPEWIAGAQTAREAIERTACYTVVGRMRFLLGLRPRFGGNESEGWAFLGRYRRHVEALPLSPLQAVLSMSDDCVVDLWGRSDGEAVRVVYGAGPFDFASRHRSEAPDDPHIREAFRRLAKVEPPVLA